MSLLTKASEVDFCRGDLLVAPDCDNIGCPPFILILGWDATEKLYLCNSEFVRRFSASVEFVVRCYHKAMELDAALRGTNLHEVRYLCERHEESDHE